MAGMTREGEANPVAELCDIHSERMGLALLPSRGERMVGIVHCCSVGLILEMRTRGGLGTRGPEDSKKMGSGSITPSGRTRRGDMCEGMAKNTAGTSGAAFALLDNSDAGNGTCGVPPLQPICGVSQGVPSCGVPRGVPPLLTSGVPLILPGKNGGGAKGPGGVPPLLGPDEADAAGLMDCHNSLCLNGLCTLRRGVVFPDRELPSAVVGELGSTKHDFHTAMPGPPT